MTNCKNKCHQLACAPLLPGLLNQYGPNLDILVGLLGTAGEENKEVSNNTKIDGGKKSDFIKKILVIFENNSALG